MREEVRILVIREDKTIRVEIDYRVIFVALMTLRDSVGPEAFADLIAKAIASELT